MAGAFIVVALLMLVCYAPLLVLTFITSVGLLYALTERLLRAFLLSVPLAPTIVLSLVFGVPALTGKTFELGCMRGGMCCGGRPFNAYVPFMQTCATPPSAPGS